MEYDSELEVSDKDGPVRSHAPAETERRGFAAGRRPGTRQAMSALAAGGDITVLGWRRSVSLAPALFLLSHLVLQII